MIRSFFYSIKQSFQQIARNKTMTFSSVLSITAMLLILGLFFVMVVNINIMTENAKNQFDMIEIYLLDDTTDEQIDQMITNISTQENVKNVEYLSKDDAMAEMKERWGENSYLLDGLSENPLPRSIRITVNDVENAESVVTYARGLSGVEDIKYSRTEVEKILKITDAIQMIALIIIIFLIIVSIVVVSNTVKLTVMARGREISIMKYVGATNWFIRGPFLGEGIIIGIVASAISGGLITLLYKWLTENYSQKMLALFSTGLVPLEFMSTNLIIIFLALGVGIGAVGSIISMRKFLDA